MLYVKNLTLAEIGDVLGVSESRVCQIHGAMKKTLRTALRRGRALPPRRIDPRGPATVSPRLRGC